MKKLIAALATTIALTGCGTAKPHTVAVTIAAYGSHAATVMHMRAENTPEPTGPPAALTRCVVRFAHRTHVSPTVAWGDLASGWLHCRF